MVQKIVFGIQAIKKHNAYRLHAHLQNLPPMQYIQTTLSEVHQSHTT